MSPLLFRLSVFLLLIFSSIFSLAQSMVEGRVFDVSNGEPLDAATIVNLTDSTTTFSNDRGRFQFKLSTPTEMIAVVYLGYQSVEVDIDKQHIFLQIGLSPLPGELGEVIVKANNEVAALQKHTGAISLVTLDNLNTGNEVSIEPILNSLPGIYMHSGALNTNRITMRGIGARSLFSTAKIRAYFNHIPLTNGIGETALEDVDLSLLDRIEVIRGPSASVYGAGLGGTIILKSRKSKYNRTILTNAIGFGSYQLLRNTHRFAHSNDAMNIGLTFNHTQSDGYRDNNDYNRNAFGLSAQFYPGPNSVVSVLANYIDLKAFIPSSIDSTSFADEPTAAAFTWQRTNGFEDYTKNNIGIAYEHRFNSLLNINGSIFTSGFRSYEVRPFNILRENSQNAGARVSLDYKPYESKQGLSFTVGSELFHENYEWSTYRNIEGLGEQGAILSNNEEQRQYLNVFGQMNITLKSSTRITAGVNLNATSYQLTDHFFADSIDFSGDYSFENTLSPRLAIAQQLSDNLSIYLAASHGFSPPTLEETLTPDGNINPDIQPEKGWNFELGSKGYAFKNRSLYFDVVLFSMLVKDLLVSQRVGPDIFIGVNAGKTTHSGVEADLRLKLKSSDSGFIQLAELSGNYAYSHFRFTEFINEENDYSDNKLTGVPEHVVNLAFDVKTQSGIYGRAAFRYVSAMPMRDDNSVFSDDFSIVNLKLGFHRVVFDRWGIDVHLGLNNVFDQKYASMILVNAGSFGGNDPRYFYPGLPRNWYGGLSLAYHFRK
ncbi:MAG: TonB-dependent receptor [Bacteroidota bacterium]